MGRPHKRQNKTLLLEQCIDKCKDDNEMNDAQPQSASASKLHDDTFHPQATSLSDCYEILVAGEVPSTQFYQSPFWNLIPASSWLSSPYLFSYHSNTRRNEDDVGIHHACIHNHHNTIDHPVAKQSSLNNKCNSRENYTLSTSDCGVQMHKTDLVDLVTNLQRELIDIKNQFIPSSLAFLTRINQNMMKNHSKHHEQDPTMTRKGKHQLQRQTSLTPENVFQKIRACCNPFESIGNALLFYDDHHNHNSKPKVYTTWNKKKKFVCRSALKLANIQALLYPISLLPSPTIVTTCTQNSDVVHTTDRQLHPQPFVFVDLCGAPGGFSEFIFFRLSCIYKSLHPSLCQGFGMSNE